MVSFFPKGISSKGLALYALSVLFVSMTFNNYAMGFVWIAMGAIEVSAFFAFSQRLSKGWQIESKKSYVRLLFIFAISIRVFWVVFSYSFYTSRTGIPFEFDCGDSYGYHEEALWLAGEDWSYVWNWLFGRRSSYSDSGYPLYLTIIYKIFGPNVILARLLKCLYSSITCVLLYRLTARTVNEQVGRMAGVFAMLMPNLIIYCGLHVKETEMLFLIVAFLERADYALRSKKANFWNILFPLLLAGSAFLFRTVLGAVELFAFITAIMFSPKYVISKGKRARIALWVVLAFVTLAGGAVMTEVEQTWQDRHSNQEIKRSDQVAKGNQWAMYATGAVMAPMIFVLPFSTMIDVGQENQMMMHGGNYVRNFMSIFVLITLYVVFFQKKNWRNFALLGSFVAGYLGAVSMSGFANAERFLLPGLPCLIIMWAYGISELTSKTFRWVKYWLVIVPIMEISWAYFKLGSRGWLS